MGKVVSIFVNQSTDPLAKFLKVHETVAIEDYFIFDDALNLLTIREVFEIAHIEDNFSHKIFDRLFTELGISLDLECNFGELTKFFFCEIIDENHFTRRDIANILTTLIIIESYTPRQLLRNIKAQGKLKRCKDLVEQNTSAKVSKDTAAA